MKRAVAAAVSFTLAAAAVAGCGAPAQPGHSDRVKIAFLLPDVQATRYDRFDVPYFATKVEALCPRCELIYRNAAELPTSQKFQAQEALDSGANVLVLDPVDAVAARDIVQLAKRRHTPVIAYDRLVERADLDYYVSFDNENIGRMQAAALVQRLQRLGVQSGKIIMINGSRTDNNALLFNKGARSVLDRTTYETIPTPDYFVPDWSPAKAQEFVADQLRTLTTGLHADSLAESAGIVGVYAANDGLAGGAISALKAAGVTELPPVTGQDGELTAIQRIMTGEQYMTVHKDYRQEAERTAEFAVALARGERPKAPTVVNNGYEDVPTVLVGVVTITRDNLQSAVIDSQLYTLGELCTAPYVSACAAARLH